MRRMGKGACIGKGACMGKSALMGQYLTATIFITHGVFTAFKDNPLLKYRATKERLNVQHTANHQPTMPSQNGQRLDFTLLRLQQFFYR